MITIESGSLTEDQKRKTVSVIIPTYNRIEWLGTAVQSVLNQTFSDFELIVVDDGSNDQTRKLVEGFDSKIRYIYQSQKGVSSARNLGIKSSSGTFIAFLDSDDQWTPQKLQIQVELFKLKPYLYIIHTDEIWIRKNRRVNQGKIHEKSGGWIFDKCLELCVISPSSAIIHRDLIKEIGLFDESLPACEDYDFWLRAANLFPVGYIPQPLIIKHGGHSDQLSKKYWGMDRFRVYSILKLLEFNQLAYGQRQAAICILVKKCDILINGAAKRGNIEDAKKFKDIRKRFV